MNVQATDLKAQIMKLDPSDLVDWLLANDGATITLNGNSYRLRCWYLDPSGPDR